MNGGWNGPGCPRPDGRTTTNGSAYSRKTLAAHRLWVQKFQAFVHSGPTDQLGGEEVRGFLSELAVRHGVAASTQNQAFNALLFFKTTMIYLQTVPSTTLKEAGLRFRACQTPRPTLFSGHRLIRMLTDYATRTNCSLATVRRPTRGMICRRAGSGRISGTSTTRQRIWTAKGPTHCFTITPMAWIPMSLASRSR